MFEWLSKYQVIFRITLQNGRRFIEETGEDPKIWALHAAACHVTGQRSFYFWAAKQWNSLLKDLQGIRNIKNFKKILFNIIFNEWNRHHWLFVFYYDYKLWFLNYEL